MPRPKKLQRARVKNLYLRHNRATLLERFDSPGAPDNWRYSQQVGAPLPRWAHARDEVGELQSASPLSHLRRAAQRGALPLFLDYHRPSWQHHPIEGFGLESNRVVLS